MSIGTRPEPLRIIKENAYMVITKAYIHKHKTEKGAWTQAQINALGIKWPPGKGWIKSLIGTEISDKQDKEFRTGIKIYNAVAKTENGKKKIGITKMIDAVDNCSRNEIDMLLDAVSIKLNKLEG